MSFIFYDATSVSDYTSSSSTSWHTYYEVLESLKTTPIAVVQFESETRYPDGKMEIVSVSISSIRHENNIFRRRDMSTQKEPRAPPR